VRAIVAAGWAVNDGAAERFAQELYRAMLREADALPFGDAVRRARQRIFDDPRFRHNNTWGAYQCYGDPGFGFYQNREIPAENVPQFVAPQELLRELKTLQARAAHIEDQGWITRLTNRTKRLEEALRDELMRGWLNGELHTAFGDTYAELLDYPAAITHYEAALEASGAKELVPLRAVEQLANLQSRFGVALRKDPELAKTVAKEAGARTWQPEELWSAAEERLKLLIQLSPSSERNALLGGHYKRVARCRTGAERKKLLEAATDYYEKAFQTASVRDNPYVLVNWIFCRLADAETKLTDKEEQTMKVAITRNLAALAAQPHVELTFWKRISAADTTLALTLIDAIAVLNGDGTREVDLVAETKKVRDLYADALKVGGTRREHASVLDTLDFLVEIFEEDNRTALANALRSAVDGLRVIVI